MYRNLCSRGCPFLVILAVIPQHYLTPKRPGNLTSNSIVKMLFIENLKKQLELS
jgi:hypothetical protein